MDVIYLTDTSRPDRGLRRLRTEMEKIREEIKQKVLKFIVERGGATVYDVYKELKLPYSTAHKIIKNLKRKGEVVYTCLLYTSPSPRDLSTSRMPSSA